ncbi:LRR receptor-like serine/threonine-protein kinase [Populus alba x Populus x berolinensis]|nr:LRR receptor-like serine/threonine-protein kinase [Populus alba x Populus x berolinensis]
MLEWVKKVQQEKKMEELVDKELGSNFCRIEVGEMLQVALLCTQFLPAHCLKMSKVVWMLKGDGLAEKWATTHSHCNSTMSLSHPSNNNKSTTSTSKHDESGLNRSSSMFGTTMDEDDDEHFLDSYAMELSSPR